MERTHDELKTLMAPFALGALTPEEERVVRGHVLSCKECQRDAESMRAAVALLTETVAPVQLPAGLTERIMAAARQDARSPAAAPVRQSMSLGRRWLSGALAGGLAVVVALGLLTFNLVRTQSQLDDSRAALTALVGGRGGFALSGSGRAVASLVPGDSGAIFVAAGFHHAPEGKTYQVWLSENGRMVSAGTFDGGELTVLHVDKSVSRANAAAVTIEPDGGSRAPTTAPLIATQ